VYWLSWRRLRPVWHHLLAVASTANLMYHFPPLFAAVRAAESSSAGSAEWSRGEFMERLFSGEALARTAHVWASSLIVAAGATMLIVARRRKRELAESATSLAMSATAPGAGLIAVSARLGLLFAFLQVPLGIWLLTAAGAASRDRLLFGDTLAGLLFVLGVLAALDLLHHLLALALGDVQTATVTRTSVLLLVVILLMVAAGAHARTTSVVESSSRAWAVSPYTLE
jgi:hypothetical protein